MTCLVQNPGLLQCERVKVIDIRAATSGEEDVLNSIKLSLDTSSKKIVVVVTQHESDRLKQFFHSNGYWSEYRKLTPEMFLLVVSDQPVKVLKSRGQQSDLWFEFQVDDTERIIYHDFRNFDNGRCSNWIKDSVRSLSKDDLLVLHLEELPVELLDNQSSINYNVDEIIGTHTRVEVKSDSDE